MVHLIPATSTNGSKFPGHHTLHWVRGENAALSESLPFFTITSFRESSPGQDVSFEL